MYSKTPEVQTCQIILTATNNTVHIPETVCYEKMGNTLEARHAAVTRTDANWEVQGLN